MRRLRILAVAVAIAAAGCSSGSESYRDVDALAAGLRKGGTPCTDLRRDDASTLVSERATCDSGGGTLSLFVFDTGADLERWLSVAAEVGDVTAGPNWAVLERPE